MLDSVFNCIKQVYADNLNNNNVKISNNKEISKFLVNLKFFYVIFYRIEIIQTFILKLILLKNMKIF